MIKNLNYKDFAERTHKRLEGRMAPQSCQFDLTYRCPYDCIHCYSKCLDKREFIKNELSYNEITGILDQVYKEGCIYLTLTGGDPLTRSDFADIYKYAKKKGFLISVFTNGFLLSKEIIELFSKMPPYNVEITVNGITKATYEKITKKKGSFKKIMDSIRLLAESKIPLVLKSNGLRENKDEILKIKSFTEHLLGEKKYKFDSFITPCLNGSTEPCLHRLEPGEILSMEKEDPDMAEQRNEGYKHINERRRRDRRFLYQCNTWETTFYITAHGRLRFCYLTDEFSSDLRKVPFREGFYDLFPKIREAPFNVETECRTCELFDHCQQCPARSFLETDGVMKPVPYFCRLAKLRQEEEKRHVSTYSTV